MNLGSECSCLGFLQPFFFVDILTACTATNCSDHRTYSKYSSLLRIEEKIKGLIGGQFALVEEKELRMQVGCSE
jgi:hypothetical protein